MRGNGNELRKKIQNYSYGLNDHLDIAKKGSTFKGLNDQTQEKVAIKVIDLRNKQSDFIKQQLNIEIEILKKLKHANLIHCLDVYSTVNNCYIITQFCDQGDLQNRIATRGPLKEAEVLVIFKDIMNGFLYLTQEKYIHGNLKPSCLFIKDKIIKISGFSNSRKINKDKEIRREVRFNYYQSPESVKENIFNHKSDIWSLGMILYVLLHGNFPWQFTNKTEFLQKVGRPYSINKQLSEEVKQFLKRSLITKQNRLSIEDLIIHPFIKKLTINSLTSQRNITTVNVKQSPTLQKHKKDNTYFNINRIEKQINAQINWMRFLFRLIERIMNYPEQFNTHVLKFIMIRQLAVQFVQLRRSFQKKQNPFNITGWNDFIKDQDKVHKYKEILNKYQTRYEKVTLSYKKFVDKISTNSTLSYLNPILNENFILSQFNSMVAVKVALQEIKKLWARITKQYPTKIKYEKQFSFRFKAELLLLDFLITYYQLNCLWIDDFHKCDNFEKNSKLQVILENQPAELDASNLQQFQFKLAQLAII